MTRALEAEIIRVDLAGELGAQRIYAGQKSVIKEGTARDIIDHMAAQEDHHLAVFEALAERAKVTPTLFTPLWKSLAYGLGAATAKLSPAAAMACTEAVEEVIEEHYTSQLNRLQAIRPNYAPDLQKIIKDFRAEEIEHRDLARAEGAHQAPVYPLLKALIRGATKLAITLSKRC